MPNWCENIVTFSHSSKDKIHELLSFIVSEKMCEYFIPIPHILTNEEISLDEKIKQTGHADWYSFCTDEWGTKWDICNVSAKDVDTEHVIECSFDTAWAPPIGVYKKAVLEGFTIHASFYSDESEYCGEFIDGKDFFYDIPAKKKDRKKMIPKHLYELYF